MDWFKGGRPTENEKSITFDHLSPDFVEEYGNHYRWANVINLDDRVYENDIANVFPDNLRNPHYPRLGLGERILSNTEGLICYPRFKDGTEYWRISDGTTAIIDWFKTQNVKASISNSGKTTLQMIQTLQGFWGVRCIAHPEIIKLLNQMAHKQVLTKSSDTVKEYRGKTVKYGRLEELINKLNGKNHLPKFSLKELNDKNVIQLGLEVECSECEHKNWYPINLLKYILACENCLKDYPFPAANPTNRKINWCYRAIGPFSKPDYAQGAYTSALALRFFSHQLRHGDNSVTWSTSLNFEISSGNETEADFVLWYQRKRLLENNYEPDLIFGEAKSFGHDSFLNKDVKRLKTLAISFPGSILVFATLKDKLSKDEKKVIAALALWGREFLPSGLTRAPVIVLTSTELFASHELEIEWKTKGGKHAEFVSPGWVHADNLRTLADLTQQLYLDMPSYHKWLDAKWRKKAQKRKKT